ncbi:MAG: hypothetical protein RIQ89_1594, partial [Bacteroidota bacterium]
NFTYGSNAVTNTFAKNFYLGNFLSDEEKESVIDQLTSINRVGIILQNKLNFTISDFNKNRKHLISIQQYTGINSKFNATLFKLFFKGNKQFAGLNATISPFSYNQIQYQSLGYTISTQYGSLVNSKESALGVNIIKGQSFQQIATNNASLYTAIDGSQLNLELSALIRSSDSSKQNFNSWNGTGLSFDFFHAIKDKQNYIQFAISQLGFIRWNSDANFLRTNKNFIYEGIYINDLFSLSDSILQQINDSLTLKPYLDTNTKKGYTALMPATISVGYQYTSDEGNKIQANVLHRLASNFFPEIVVHYLFNFNHIMAGPNLIMGGYTTANAGALVGYHSKYLNFQLSANYLLSTFSSRGNGIHAGLTLSTNF